MNMLQDIITYIRRIIKSPSNSTITDNLLIDYINRFWLMDVDARIQTFDLKTKYQFVTTPGVDRYNMPLYSLQVETGEPNAQVIASFPVYQGFTDPAFVNGFMVPLYTQKNEFFAVWPNYIQSSMVIDQGNGTGGPYTLTIPFGYSQTIPPQPNMGPSGIVRGHVDMNGVISANTIVEDPIFGTQFNLLVPTTSVSSAVYFTATDNNGNNVTVADSGQFLSLAGSNSPNHGLLMYPGQAPFGNAEPFNGYLNTFVITGVTQANPAVLTATTNFLVGQEITIGGVNGMTELNGNTYTVTAVTATQVTINVNSLGFTAYISGGTASSISNVINYQTGVATNVIFPSAIPEGQNITALFSVFAPGMPRSILFYNNILTLRSIPYTQYVVELDAYLTPAAFLSTTGAIPFGYMAEYIARGAARKILSDTGDIEQFQFYEPLFREQEILVWKRSQRIFTSTRVETIYSRPGNHSNNHWGM